MSEELVNVQLTEEERKAVYHALNKVIDRHRAKREACEKILLEQPFDGLDRFVAMHEFGLSYEQTKSLPRCRESARQIVVWLDKAEALLNKFKAG